MALVWDVQDVHTAANEREVALTNREAIKVLQELHHYHNKQYGLQWKDVTSYIEEYALGRKLAVVTASACKPLKASGAGYSGPRLECKVSPKSLPVLVRRLMESDDEGAESLASDICQTLEIEII